MFLLMVTLLLLLLCSIYVYAAVLCNVCSGLSFCRVCTTTVRDWLCWLRLFRLDALA